MFFRNLMPVRASSFRKSKAELKSLQSARILKKAKAQRDTRLEAQQVEEVAQKTETISIADWQRKLGEVVPLSMVPDILGANPGFVAMAVREGRLPVHTFKTPEGKAFRVVKVNTLKALAKLSRDPKNLWEISLYYGLMQKDEVGEQSNQSLAQDLNQVTDEDEKS